MRSPDWPARPRSRSSRSGSPPFPPQDRAQVLAFQRQTGQLQRAVMGSQRALDVTPAATEELHANARALELRLTDLSERLNGDRTRASRQEPDLPGIASRVNQVVFGHWRATHGPTQIHREQYQIAADLFSDLYNDLEDALEVDLTALEDRMEAIGAPWTPGRGLPDWP